MQAGGWSLTWQGDKTKTSDYPNADTLLAAMRKSLGAGAVDYSADGTGVDVSRYSAIVMVAAEKPYAEGAGDIVFPASMRHTSRYPRRPRGARAGQRQGRAGRDLACSRAGRSPRTTSSTAPTRSSLPGCREPKGSGSPTCCWPARRPPAFDFTGRLSFDWPAGDCLPQQGGVQFRRGYGLSLAQPRRRLGPLPESPPIVACPAESR